MYKNRVSDGKNVPVSTREFPLFWRVIFQREASFGSLFVTVQEKPLVFLVFPFFGGNIGWCQRAALGLFKLEFGLASSVQASSNRIQLFLE
jgi:hypothetical protein